MEDDEGLSGSGPRAPTAERGSASTAAAAAGRGRLRAHALAAALVLTGLGALKPVVIDETIYLEYARQFAAHPTDPYGFEVLWYDAPQPASEVVVPPLLPYWLGLARSVVGESVVGAKLALLPFALAFAFGLVGLLRRLAPGLEAPLLWMCALSPAVLPAMNVMLDVPAIGLSLVALLAFVRACETRDPWRAALAGLIAGLAMQTKYSAVLGVGAIGLYALLFARGAFGLVAAACAGLVFSGWEVLMHALYGQSHFVHGLAVVDEQFGVSRPVGWALSFLGLIGALLPTVAWLALAARRVSPRWLFAAAAVIALAFGAVALLPKEPVALQGADYPVPGAWRPELLVFAPLGVGIVAAIGALFAGELRRVAGAVGDVSGAGLRQRLGVLPDAWRRDAFVLAWLALEVVGLFVVSPYPAARRVIGTGLVATILAGRVAGRSGRRVRVVAAAVATGLLVGVFLGAEHSDARARRDGVARAVERTEALGCSTTWYAGHWGFQHYAERAGLRPVVPGHSRLVPGDCLLVPEAVHRQRFTLLPAALREVPPVATYSRWPWRSIPSYYVGPLPLRAQSIAHVEVRVFVVVRRWTPRP